MRYRAVIFDFDGTLVRSHRAVYEVVERLTRRRRTVEMPTPEAFRKLGMRELLALMNVRGWQIPWFTFRARALLRAKINAIEFEPGVIDVLRRARAAGLRLAVVSSNSKGNVVRVLARHDALALFEVIEAGASLFGKRRTLRRALVKLALNATEVLTVGDETRDIDAARAAGLAVAAVAWGFRTGEALEAHAPDFVVKTPADLSALLGLD